MNKTLLAILSLISISTLLLYTNPLSLSQSTPIIEYGILKIDRPSENLNSSDFKEILSEVSNLNEQQPEDDKITTLELNLPFNKITVLDFSPFQKMDTLNSLFLNLTQNTLDGSTWPGFEVFQNMPNLRNITIDLNIQGEYHEDRYGVKTLIPSLENVDFLSYFDNLPQLQFFMLNFSESHAQNIQKISALNNSKNLLLLSINAKNVYNFDFTGFEQLEDVQKVFQFELITKNSNAQNIQYLGDFIINQGGLKTLSLNLERAFNLTTLDFLKDFSQTQLIANFYFSAVASQIDSIRGLSQALNNMLDLQFFELSLQENQIQDIQALSNLSNCPYLSSLVLDFTLNGAISDISPLNQVLSVAQFIRSVNISFTFDKVVSIQPIENLGNLSNLQYLSLNFKENEVESAEYLYPLLDLNGLQSIYLNFFGNSIEGFSEFRHQMMDKYPQADILPYI